jgi:hypothetical protein
MRHAIAARHPRQMRETACATRILGTRQRAEFARTRSGALFQPGATGTVWRGTLIAQRARGSTARGDHRTGEPGRDRPDRRCGRRAVARDRASLVELAEPAEPITSPACAPGGQQLVVGTAGGKVWVYDLWFHRAADDHRVYLATGIAKVSPAAFSDDGAQFVAPDPAGRALVVDMTALALW